jgi:hypothetical protein
MYEQLHQFHCEPNLEPRFVCGILLGAYRVRQAAYVQVNMKQFQATYSRFALVPTKTQRNDGRRLNPLEISLVTRRSPEAESSITFEGTEMNLSFLISPGGKFVLLIRGSSSCTGSARR